MPTNKIIHKTNLLVNTFRPFYLREFRVPGTRPVGGKVAAQFMRDGLTVTHPDGQLTVHGFTDFDAAAFILENDS